MEEREMLNLETGTKESVALKPAPVKIVKVAIEAVGEKKNLKLVCEVKHPDRDELIKVSSAKYEKHGKLQTVGLWVNLDEDENIRKGSGLAVLMEFLGAKKPTELESKQANTVEDERGYLCFKAY